MPDGYPTCPRRNFAGHGTRCIRPPGHDGDCDFPGGLNPEPRAAHPWRVELCWTPDQQFGRVLAYPSRAPLFAVWDLLAAGESFLAVAAEHGLTEEQVRVLDLLRRELLAPDPDGDDAYSRVILTLQADVDALAQERDELLAAAAELVRLKDGPRDDAYRAAKDAAWERARRVMRGYEQLADAEGDRVEAVHIPTRAEVMAALTHDGWCDLQIHAACCGKGECNCAVADLVDQLTARGWRPHAGEAAL